MELGTAIVENAQMPTMHTQKEIYADRTITGDDKFI